MAKSSVRKTTVRSPEGEIRVQVPLNADAVAKIDELADRMNVGRGRMAAMLLEAGIEENELLVKIVTSSVAKPLVDIVKSWKGKDPANG